MKSYNPASISHACLMKLSGCGISVGNVGGNARGEKPTRIPVGLYKLLILFGNLVAGELGFEPRLAESESAVLPLDDSPPERSAA